jgi:heterodisulfide reductase subunit A
MIPPVLVRTDVIRSAIVLGNGLSAATVSLELAAQGFDVDLLLIGEGLVEPALYAFADERGRQDAITRIASIHSSPHIRSHHDCEISSVKGHAGDFEITFNEGGRSRCVKGGAIVLAHEPDLVDGKTGESSVVTNNSLRGMIDANGTIPNVVVFIEGSDAKGSCPSQGTTASIENALAIKKRRPEAQVYVLVRDIDAPGTFERTYQMAQRKGVVFVRGELSYRPSPDDPGSLIINDPVVGEIRVRPDLIVREATFDIQSNSHLARKLGLRSSDNGMVQGFSARLHAGETTKEGVFVCQGLNASLLASDNISEACAVASSVSELLSKSFLEHGAEVAFVDKEKCSACLACVRICPYDAPLLDEKGKAEIQVAICQGCGICVSLCPSKAIDQKRWTDAQLSAETSIVSKGEWG